MEIFYIALVAALFLWMRNSLTSVTNSIKTLANELRKLREELQKSPGKVTEEHRKQQATAAPFEAPIATPPPVVHEEKPTPPQSIPVPEKTPVQIPPPFEKMPQPVFVAPSKPARSPRPSFFERHPDLEKFIGENLINKIGIAILVLGIGFFVKYAIDKDWIHEIGRVAIGILTGGLLIGIAHRLRLKYKAFSSVLVGGGLSVLYFTITIAFHEYHNIFTQTSAFIIMVVITAFAVLLSIAYNRMELAVLAIIGGFSSPFMVSNGEGNYKVLFTYLLILNIGMMILAYRKKWNLVNILCYIFTVILYGSWLVLKCLDTTNAPYAGALLFGTAFYVIFFLMNILYNIQRNAQFKSFDIGMLLSNTALYYAAGMGILYYYYGSAYQGLFTVLMGVFNFGFAFALYKKQTVDRNLIYLLIGLVLTFISLAAPIQLEGNHITLFWAAEAVLLLWFSQKSGIGLIRVTSALVSALMVVSLLMDWTGYYLDGDQVLSMPFLNKIFLTGIISLVSVVLSRKLLDNEKEDFFVIKDFRVSVYKSILGILGLAILYFSISLELTYQLSHRYGQWYAVSICLGIYNFSFLIIAYLLLRKKMSQAQTIFFCVASALCLGAYVMNYNDSIIASRNDYMEGAGNGRFFLLHFVLLPLVGMGLYIFNQSVKTARAGNGWIKWITVFLLVYISSAELNHLGTWFSYQPGRIIYYINQQVDKTGYTVLWGLISFALMQQGMKRKDRMLRVISLSLFFITILKLFLWDIRGISEAGKIIAFISLGVILLIVSFMYQRLKRLILENDTPGSGELKEQAT